MVLWNNYAEFNVFLLHIYNLELIWVLGVIFLSYTQ